MKNSFNLNIPLDHISSNSKDWVKWNRNLNQNKRKGCHRSQVANENT